MPGLNLSSLNAQELRNILEAARSRNQPELTQEVLSELHSRRARPAGRVPWRVLEPDHEPMEAPDAWWEDLKHEAVLPEEPPRSKAPVFLGIVAAVVVSAGLGWWLGPRLTPRTEQPAVPTLELPPAVVVDVSPASPPSALDTVDRSLQTPAPPIGAPQTSAAVDSPAAQPPPQRLAKAEPSAHTTVKPKLAPATKSPVCRAKPTPADRVICGYPSLAAQHQRMRDAYDRAIDAGADPRLIDGAQAEWRTTRDAVTDPDRLAKLYSQRIRELDAAARAARDEPPT